MRTLIVVDVKANWPAEIEGAEIVEARSYLTEPGYTDLRNAQVFNLCRSYRYQSLGYYVSLLAEARRHRPVPNITTLQDLKSPSLFRSEAEDFDDLLQRSLSGEAGGEASDLIVFGRTLEGRRDRLCGRLFRLFPAPFLQASFTRQAGTGRWLLSGLSAVGSRDIPKETRPRVMEFARDFFAQPNIPILRRRTASFDLAILHDPKEADSPSNPRALKNFVRAAEKLGMEAEVIERDDYEHLPEFDALFIRATTHINHYTYRFSRRAAAEGMVVIDDPVSISRCTNKVYLAELLRRHGIPIPETYVVHAANVARIPEVLGLPAVLKLPDSSFSQGMERVDEEADLMPAAQRLLERSDLFVAQRYLPTEFDWRVGILDGRALWVCKYFMARRHWQIIKRDEEGHVIDGASETLPVEAAPPKVVETALRAARLIGKGLYGVDLKEVNGGCVVMEINDNPNIDAGVEDAILGAELYRVIMDTILRRLETLRGLERKV